MHVTMMTNNQIIEKDLKPEEFKNFLYTLPKEKQEYHFFVNGELENNPEDAKLNENDNVIIQEKLIGA